MRHRRSVIRTVLVLASLGGLAGVAACAEQAPEPPAWDVAVATTTGLWDTVPVTLTWSLDGSTAPGFSVELPAELRPLVAEAGAVTVDGKPVGQIEVDGGTAHVTWDAGRRGQATAELATVWDTDDVGAGEDVELTFRAGAQEVAQQVRIREDEADLSDGRLYGYWADRENEDRLDPEDALQWRYVTPVGSGTPVHLTVDAGQELDCGAITFRALADGDEGREIPSSETPEVTCTSREVEVVLQPRTPDEALMLLVPATPVLAAPSYTAEVAAVPEALTSAVDRAVDAGAAPAESSAPPDVRAVATTIAGALAASLALAVIVIAAARHGRSGTRT